MAKSPCSLLSTRPVTARRGGGGSTGVPVPHALRGSWPRSLRPAGLWRRGALHKTVRQEGDGVERPRRPTRWGRCLCAAQEGAQGGGCRRLGRSFPGRNLVVGARLPAVLARWPASSRRWSGRVTLRASFLPPPAPPRRRQGELSPRQPPGLTCPPTFCACVRGAQRLGVADPRGFAFVSQRGCRLPPTAGRGVRGPVPTPHRTGSCEARLPAALLAALWVCTFVRAARPLAPRARVALPGGRRPRDASLEGFPGRGAQPVTGPPPACVPSWTPSVTPR